MNTLKLSKETKSRLTTVFRLTFHWSTGFTACALMAGSKLVVIGFIGMLLGQLGSYLLGVRNKKSTINVHVVIEQQLKKLLDVKKKD